MSRSKQIGWSNESNLLYELINEVKRLRTITATLETGDLEIGAVEMKDHTTDVRASVKDGSTMLTTDPAVSVADANALVELSAISATIGNVETPSMTAYAAGTTIAAGAKSVTIITGSTYAGNILGTAATADGIYTFAASPGNTLGAIAITCTAGNFTVLKTV